jgi:hypothetical protein
MNVSDIWYNNTNFVIQTLYDITVYVLGTYHTLWRNAYEEYEFR